MEYLVAGVAYFFFVFFKAFQQRNVAFLHYKWVMPTSYLMAGTEIFVYAIVSLSVLQAGGLHWGLIWFALAVGTGGGIGALLAMRLHAKHLGVGIKKSSEPGGEKVKIGGNNE